VEGVNAALEKHAAGIGVRVASPITGLDEKSTRVGFGLLDSGDSSEFAMLDKIFDGS
jgi:hypothetical protein